MTLVLYQKTNSLPDVVQLMPRGSCKLHRTKIQREYARLEFISDMPREINLTSSFALTIHFSNSARPDFTYSPFENVQHSRRSSRLPKKKKRKFNSVLSFLQLRTRPNQKQHTKMMSSCLLNNDMLMKENTWVISLRMKKEGT